MSNNVKNFGFDCSDKRKLVLRKGGQRLYFSHTQTTTSSGCECATACVNLYAETKRPVLVLHQMAFSDLKDLHSERRTPRHKFFPVLPFSEVDVNITRQDASTSVCQFSFFRCNLNLKLDLQKGTFERL